jgi:hypothetical protein
MGQNSVKVMQIDTDTLIGAALLRFWFGPCLLGWLDQSVGKWIQRAQRSKQWP